MKTNFLPAVILLSGTLLSCDERDRPTPQQNPVILPVRLELDDLKRELIFDEENRLSRVKTSSFMPGGVVLESTMEYFYASDGKLEKAVTDQGYRLEYTWQEGRIVRTDEYLQDTFSQYHTFSYDVRGDCTSF